MPEYPLHRSKLWNFSKFAPRGCSLGIAWIYMFGFMYNTIAIATSISQHSLLDWNYRLEHHRSFWPCARNATASTRTLTPALGPSPSACCCGTRSWAVWTPSTTFACPSISFSVSAGLWSKCRFLSLLLLAVQRLFSAWSAWLLICGCSCRCRWGACCGWRVFLTCSRCLIERARVCWFHITAWNCRWRRRERRLSSLSLPLWHSVSKISGELNAVAALMTFKFCGSFFSSAGGVAGAFLSPWSSFFSDPEFPPLAANSQKKSFTTKLVTIKWN